MNINPLVISALSPLNVPIAPIRYQGSETTYITFYTYNEQPALISDDIPEFDVTSGTVDIFSQSDYKTLLKDAKKRLRNAGFSVSQGPEMYEDDTKYYHVIINIQIGSESEE